MTMIVVVDDDATTLEIITASLVREGYDVKRFMSAGEALIFMTEHEPDLIISDIIMPEMSGFELKETYSERFSSRLTPFVFLTGLSDEQDIINGLRYGVDDYLVKPVKGKLLAAKVGSVINRRARYLTPEYRGIFDGLSFLDIMRFLERRSISGTVEIRGSRGQAPISVSFRNGSIQLGDDVGDEAVESLLAISEGEFVIRPERHDFSEIEQLARAEDEPADEARPGITTGPEGMGRLTGLEIDKRLLQIQTEVLSERGSEVVTTAFLDGRTVLKRQSSPAGDCDTSSLREAVRRQHQAVIDEVRDRLEELEKARADSVESPRQKLTRLLRLGSEYYLKKRYDMALAVLQEAHRIDPGNRLLERNLEILRKRITP
jgi:DNA-binding response OmpR family regulator